MHDFRSFVNALEQSGELVRISKQVDPKFELPALMAKLEEAGKAFRFDNVKGAKMPLVGGIYLGEQRLGRALGASEPDEFSHAVGAAMFGKAIANPVPPEPVATSPVKEVIKTGSDIDLSEMPIPTFFELDTGAFITAAVGVTNNPETGELNVGVYRGLVMGKDRLSMNASTFSDLRRIYKASEESGKELSMAIVLGVEPAVIAAAVSKPPPGMTELAVAGGLNGAPIELVKCETNDLLVPANAEIVIEGKIDFKETVWQTLGEYPGLYGPETDPILQVTAITHRKDPLFYSILAGPNEEQVTIGTISIYSMAKIATDEIKAKFSNIVDTRLLIDPRWTGPMFQLFIQIDKKSDAEPMEIIKATYESAGGIFPMNRVIKRIVIVDQDIDIQSYADVEYAVWTRVADPSKIMTFPGYVSWELDRAQKEDGTSVRIGIDATMDLDDVDKLVRPRIPGYEEINLDDYLDT